MAVHCHCKRFPLGCAVPTAICSEVIAVRCHYKGCPSGVLAVKCPDDGFPC